MQCHRRSHRSRNHAIMLDAAAGDERAAALLEKIKVLPLDQALDIIGEWRTNE